MSTLILVRKIWGIKKSKKRSKKTRQAREKMHWVQQLYILLVSILNVKGTSNLIKGVSSHNVCFGIKRQQMKKKKLSFNTTKLIFLRILLFHFIKSQF